MRQDEALPEQEIPPATFELEQADLYGKYMLSSHLDILFILRSMAKRGCLATIYFNQAQSFFLTCILAVSADERSLVLDLGADEAVNREALQASRLLVSANLDNVKIQFALTGLHMTSYQGSPAFQAAVPEALLRLQRREYFRLELSPADPVLCQITIGGSDGGLGHTLEFPLLDISGGGLGLKAPGTTGHFFEPGTTHQHCRLHIPDESVIPSALCVRTSIPVINKRGEEFLRVGCEFVGLPGARLTMIQRYITRIERQRKARQSGLE